MNANIVQIGRIFTPYNNLQECPSNVDDQSGPICEMVFEDDYKQGIKGLKAGDVVDIMYWLHESPRDKIVQSSIHSSDDKKPTGVFNLRSPNRPNPIGLAKLTLVGVTENSLMVRGLDCLTGTMLVDVKPAIT